jgi:antirestriction protein ArdC
MDRHDDISNLRKRQLIDGMIDSSATDRDRKKIVDTLAQYPIEFVQIAAESNGKIRPLKPQELFRDASPAIDRLGSGPDSWGVVPAGMFVSAENTLYLRSVTAMTIAHEFGHLLDNALGHGEYLSNTNRQIRSAFDNASEFVTPYSASGKDEMFAEAVRAFAGLNDEQSLWPRVSPERLRSVSPEMSAFLDSTVVELSLRFAERDRGADIASPIKKTRAQTADSRDGSETAGRTSQVSSEVVGDRPKRGRDAPDAKTGEKKPAAKDVYRQKVTDEVIAAMEKGQAPWQRGWSSGEVGAPYNVVSKKAYRGGNIMNLMLTDMVRGYDDSRWMTIKQADDLGYTLKPGESKKGVWVEYWDFKNARPSAAEPPVQAPPAAGAKTELDPTADDGVANGGPPPPPAKTEPAFRRARAFYSTVYNAAQFENVPPLERKEQAWGAVGVWETVKNLLTNAGVDIKHDGGDRAFYRPSDPDAIHLPAVRLFDSEAELAGTALHEGVHWTNNKDRIDRTSENRGMFGSPEYARGELVAEMGASIMAATMGLPRDPDNSAVYVAGWIKVLQNDKNALFQAASQAQEAADFIFDRALEKVQELAEEAGVSGTELTSAAIAAIASETSNELTSPDDLLITPQEMAIGIAINSMRIYEPKPTDIVQERELQTIGTEQSMKIAGRSPDGQRVFGQSGGVVLSVSRDTFAEPPKIGKTMTVSRDADGLDVVQNQAREVVLER